MISVKKTGEGKRTIEVSGNNLEIIDDLLAAIHSVTEVVFEGSDRERFIKDIPYLISETHPDIFAIELPCHPEDLKAFGGEKE